MPRISDGRCLGVEAEEISRIYGDAYHDEPFVRRAETPPHTKWTFGSNLAYVYPYVESRTRRLIVISALDNLMKGAAGQAVQCANLMYSLPETMGLPLEGVYP